MSRTTKSRWMAFAVLLVTGLAIAPSVHALAVPQTGASWATNANALGATGTNVDIGFVEADVSAAPGYQYRINPRPTNGWDIGYWPDPDVFMGMAFRYYDDGDLANTSYSWHATGVARAGVGRNRGEGDPAEIGMAPGCTNVGSYEANYFADVYMASNLSPPDKVFSFAFITDTGSQPRVTAEMDRLVDDYGKVFVAGIAGTNMAATWGGPNVAGIAASYNIITVGCSDGDYTNWGGASQYGPAYGFGTAKPDLLPAANSGSEAAGRGAGAAALIVQQARDMNLAGGSDPRVVKAILLAGARKTVSWDKGSPGAGDDHSVPLDYYAGAGFVHCVNNYGIMYGGEVSPGSTNVRAAWDFGSVGAGQTNVYFLDLPQTDVYVSVVLAWNRHVGAGYTNLQDLNLHLYSATGTTLYTHLDWSTSLIDSVEHVYYLAPATGRYAMAVDGGRASSSESYGLAFNLVGTSNSPLLDADADGLPDSFEYQYFREIYFYGATNDPDDDYANNYEEYVADTAPTNGASIFAVELAYASNGDMNVSFSSSTARQYRAHYNSDFATNAEAWVAASNFFYGNGGTTNWVDDGTETSIPPSNAPFRVYRVRVRIP
ncbi:MAG: hypothetical protein V1873_03480 [Verrucomicrobiota bacterium]